MTDATHTRFTNGLRNHEGGLTMLKSSQKTGREFTIYQTGQSVSELADEWHDLIEHSGLQHSPFQTPEWCMTWLAMNPHTTPCFVTIRQNGMLVFLAPLMLAKSAAGLRWLSFFSHPDSKYGSVIWDKNHDGAILFEECVSFLQDEAACDLLVLNDIGEEQVWIGDFAIYQRPSELEYSSIVKIGKAKDGQLMSNLSKTMRRDVRLAIRRLEALGKISFDIAPCDNAWLKDIFPQMLEWKMAWLKQRGRWGNGIFDNSFRNLVSVLVQTSNCGSFDMRCAIVRLNGKPVSADIHFAQGNTAFGYFSSFDTSIPKVSLGTLRDYYMIDWLSSNEYDYFDLLGYPELYKDRLSDIDRKLINLHIPLNLKGDMANSINRINFRQVAKKLYYQLPANWRKKAVQRLRSKY